MLVAPYFWYLQVLLCWILSKLCLLDLISICLSNRMRQQSVHDSVNSVSVVYLMLNHS